MPGCPVPATVAWMFSPHHLNGISAVGPTGGQWGGGTFELPRGGSVVCPPKQKNSSRHCGSLVLNFPHGGDVAAGDLDVDFDCRYSQLVDYMCLQKTLDLL